VVGEKITMKLKASIEDDRSNLIIPTIRFFFVD
jgi:hypothetical protein